MIQELRNLKFAASQRLSLVLAIFNCALTVLVVFAVLFPFPYLFSWRNQYSFTLIEVRCWIDVNGTHGYEVVPLVRMVPLDSNANPEGYNWVVADLNGFKLDNRYGYAFAAPEECYGKRFLFWQSQKTSMIIPNRTLVLEPDFESDTWWQNYG